jgi:NAD(P)-dependent dehydrogenase (short-subunit alcohol dehydrogenase family)
MKEFTGKVAVITGAASGIGRAMAERCVKEGMKVVLAGVNEANLLKAEAELKVLSGAVISVQTDVARRSDVEALAQKTLDTFGAVHLLVNNAGVGAGLSPWEATWNDWEWVIGVNLWGVIHGVKIFTPIMLAQNTECHIVNTSSFAGLIGGGSAPYVVSKNAVVALSETLYLALQQRNALINVSLLCPGFVKTNISASERNRPAILQDAPTEMLPQAKLYYDFMNAAVEAGISPLKVADQVFDAIREGQFYIFIHPEFAPVVQQRVESLLRAENPKNPAEVFMKLINLVQPKTQ